MDNRVSNVIRRSAGPSVRASLLSRLSVGRRVALITAVPVFGLAIVFALFTLSQRQVSAQMGASRTNLQAALGVKQIRDHHRSS